MSNVLDRAREAISLFRRAEELMQGVTSDIRDGREAVNETRLDRLEEMLKADKLETQAAADDLGAAIKEYRKRQAG